MGQWFKETCSVPLFESHIACSSFTALILKEGETPKNLRGENTRENCYYRCYKVANAMAPLTETVTLYSVVFVSNGDLLSHT